MARYHNATSMTILESIDDVDEALKEIGTLELVLRQIDDDTDKKVKKLKEESAKRGEVSRDKIKELTAKIENYAALNKALFKTEKTKDLTFGSFGYRQSTKTSTKKSTLADLKDLIVSVEKEIKACEKPELKEKLLQRYNGLKSCIEVKESLNKTDIRSLSDYDLKSIGASVVVKDTFFCEAKTIKVNQELMKKA